MFSLKENACLHTKTRTFLLIIYISIVDNLARLKRGTCGHSGHTFGEYRNDQYRVRETVMYMSRKRREITGLSHVFSSV